MSNRFSAAIRTAIALATIAFAASASAETYRWSFQDADGSYGGLISGSFNFDGANYSDWDILTSQSPLHHPTKQASVAYTTLSSHIETFSGGLRISDNHLIPGPADGLLPASTLILHFSPLAQDGNIAHGYLEEMFNSAQGLTDYRSGNFALAGVAIAPPVPEPETALMAAFGLAMVGAVARRRRQAPRPH